MINGNISRINNHVGILFKYLATRLPLSPKNDLGYVIDLPYHIFLAPSELYKGKWQKFSKKLKFWFFYLKFWFFNPFGGWGKKFKISKLSYNQVWFIIGKLVFWGFWKHIIQYVCVFVNVCYFLSGLWGGSKKINISKSS